MPPKSYSANFAGYWAEPNIAGIPSKSGVYCVYACTYDKEANTVSIRKLLYIGESQDVKTEVSNNKKWDDWRKHLNKGEMPCFNFAPFEADDRKRVEAALIFHHKPPENSEYRDTFPFDETTVSTLGKNSELSEKFTVPRTEKQND